MYFMVTRFVQQAHISKNLHVQKRKKNEAIASAWWSIQYCQLRDKNSEYFPQWGKYSEVFSVCRIFLFFPGLLAEPWVKGRNSTELHINIQFLRRSETNKCIQSAYALHILNNRHKYGPKHNTMEPLKHINKTKSLIPYEQLYIQSHHITNNWFQSKIAVNTTRCIVRLKRGGTSLREKAGFKGKQANGVGTQLMKRDKEVTACTALLPCYYYDV
jgi:hypothetical protein